MIKDFFTKLTPNGVRLNTALIREIIVIILLLCISVYLSLPGFLEKEKEYRIYLEKEHRNGTGTNQNPQ